MKPLARDGLILKCVSEVIVVPDKRSIEQIRASHALKEIKELQSKGIKEYGHFKSYTSSLPASIVMNGLGQAMAFERSHYNDEKEKGHKYLYDIMEKWLCNTVYTNEKDLMKAITNHGLEKYLHAQREALAYLEWLKKFSRAYLETQKTAKEE